MPTNTRLAWRLPLVAVAMLLASLALAPLARASLHWPGAAQDLSTAGQYAPVPEAAIDPQGRTTVVWMNIDGMEHRVQAARIGADGTPEAIHNLSAPGEEQEEGAVVPQVAVDSQGRATVVWWRYDGSNWRIQEVRIAADGTLGTVHDLSAAGQNSREPQVAVDSQGRATVVWWTYDGSSYRIQEMRIAADGTLGTVQTLSPAGGFAVSPQLAIDANDRATVVWEKGDGSNSRIQETRIAADGTPGAVQYLSAADQDSHQERVAVDSQGRATVVWERFDGTSARVQTVRIGANGTPGTVHDLSTGPNAFFPQVAVDSRDRATVVWEREGGTGSIQVVRIGADGTPGAVQDLTALEESGSGPRVAIDSQDRATVVWYLPEEIGETIQAVRIGAGGTPGTVQTLTPTEQSAWQARVVIDAQDRPTVIWSWGSWPDERIQAVRGIASPPAAPTFNSSSPASPANDDSPKLIGSADPGSTVNVYPTADCSGSPVATGTATKFASPGLEVSVPDDSTMAFHATATDTEGETSACSASSITYVEQTPAAPPPTGGGSGGDHGAPSNPTQPPTGRLAFVGRPKLDKRKGTAVVTVEVPGQGTLALTGKGLKPIHRAGGPAPVRLQVEPTGKAKRALDRAGRLTVEVTVTFSPTGGTPASERVTLIKGSP